MAVGTLTTAIEALFTLITTGVRVSPRGYEYICVSGSAACCPSSYQDLVTTDQTVISNSHRRQEPWKTSQMTRSQYTTTICNSLKATTSLQLYQLFDCYVGDFRPGRAPYDRMSQNCSPIVSHLLLASQPSASNSVRKRRSPTTKIPESRFLTTCSSNIGA